MEWAARYCKLTVNWSHIHRESNLLRFPPFLKYFSLQSFHFHSTHHKLNWFSWQVSYWNHSDLTILSLPLPRNLNWPKCSRKEMMGNFEMERPVQYPFHFFDTYQIFVLIILTFILSSRFQSKESQQVGRPAFGTDRKVQCHLCSVKCSDHHNLLTHLNNIHKEGKPLLRVGKLNSCSTTLINLM